MSSKTQRILNSLKSRPEVKTPIATDMFLPNNSGDTRFNNVFGKKADFRDANGNGWVFTQEDTGASAPLGMAIGYSLNGASEVGAIRKGLFITPEDGATTSSLDLIHRPGTPWFKIQGDYSAGTITFKQQLGTLNTTIFEDGNVQVDNNLTVTTDCTVSGEMKGSRVTLPFGNAAQNNLGAGAFQWQRMINGVTMSATKGFVMHQAGSLIGVSVNYDVTSLSAPDPDLILEVLIGGSVVLTLDLNEASTGNDRKAYTSQARGTDTFNANQVISIRLKNDGTGSVQVDEILGFIDLQLDA